jgi:hypothetical protein
MSNARRLSRGSSHLGDFESDEESVEELRAEPLMSRRRSSAGLKAMNPKEQSRIADMYKTVIKLAAENVSRIR